MGGLPPPPLEPQEYRDIHAVYLGLLRHEDDLIDRRATTFVLLHTIMFNAYVLIFALSAPALARTHIWLALLLIVSGFGFCFSVLWRAAVVRTVSAHRNWGNIARRIEDSFPEHTRVGNPEDMRVIDLAERPLQLHTRRYTGDREGSQPASSPQTILERFRRWRELRAEPLWSPVRAWTGRSLPDAQLDSFLRVSPLSIWLWLPVLFAALWLCAAAVPVVFTLYP